MEETLRIDGERQLKQHPSRKLRSRAPGEQMQYQPNFPHAHYHRYNIVDGALSNIGDQLRLRVEDLSLLANHLGAKSILDVGSNLGGFLFFLEKRGQLRITDGIDISKTYIQDSNVVAGLIDSQSRFFNCGLMQFAPDTTYDLVLLQNVYHYIYDETGSHEAIFRKLASIGRAVVWYNPVSADDPVIPIHAHKNPKANWEAYAKSNIIDAAINAGFLYPIPLKLRFKGMGPMREHLLFIKDDVRVISPNVVRIPSEGVEEVPIKDHYKSIHRVVLDGSKAYKIFLTENIGWFDAISESISLGLFDENTTGPVDFVHDDANRCIGYSQGRGVRFATAKEIIGAPIDVAAKFLYLRLLSRMLRHKRYCFDFGEHNLVFLPDRIEATLIDIETFVDDEQRLSPYSSKRSNNDIRGAAENMALLFPGASLDFQNSSNNELIRQCVHELANSSFILPKDIFASCRQD